MITHQNNPFAASSLGGLAASNPFAAPVNPFTATAVVDVASGTVLEGADLRIDMELGADILIFQLFIHGVDEFLLEFLNILFFDHEPCSVVMPAKIKKQMRIVF